MKFLPTKNVYDWFIAWENITAWNALYVSNWAWGRTAWRVYKASSLYTTYSDMWNFIWFAIETTTIWNNIRVWIWGINQNQTGLTIWVIYYLTDTSWTIWTTPWTNPVIVWVAISTTSIQIRERNRVIWVTTSRDISTASWTVTYTHTLGTIPKSIIAQSVTSNSWTSWIMVSNWLWDWKTNYNCAWMNNAYTATSINWSYAILWCSWINWQYQTWTIQNVTATSFDVAWVKIGNPTWTTVAVTFTLFE